MSFWGIVIAAFIGSLAWLYQKAWDRQESKQQAYKKMLHLLPAFHTTSHDPDKIDEFLNETRGLMLFAPDEVVLAATEFLEGSQFSLSDEEKEARLSRLILSMRKDCSFLAALSPGFWSSKLSSTELALKVSNRQK